MALKPYFFKDMATINKNFGDKMRKLRKSLNMSQQELAEKAHLDLTSVNEIENGARNPMLKTIRKIASALGVSIKELF